MPTEIAAGRSWPTQWRYDQTPGSKDRGAFALGVGVQQHTRANLIRLYIEFEPGPGFPEDERENYPSDEEENVYPYASRYVNRRTLLDNLGFPRPGERRAPGATPPNLPRALEVMIWGREAGRGRIGKLVAVHIADGPR